MVQLDIMNTLSLFRQLKFKMAGKSEKDLIIVDKITSMIEDESFFDYLLEEAFKSVDKQNKGLVKIDQIKELLSDMALELKLPKPSAKDLDTVMSLFTDKQNDLTLEQFKLYMKSYLKKICDSAHQAE